ncbi:hypothetical protein EON82_09885 [bacterium]|nr:MAG: hypothetical protein EON82_09885 [bacterium]
MPAVNTPPSRSDLIVHQLILASELPEAMPVVHPEHRVMSDGTQVDGHALVPVGPDVLVLTRRHPEDAKASLLG